MSTPQCFTEFRPLVLSGPSAVGKGTLTAMLFAKYPSLFGKKVSTTTRGPRVGEEHQVHYYFITREEFLAQEEQCQFIETALIHGNKYGTSIQAVVDAGKGSKIPLLELDIQGVSTINNLIWDEVLSTLKTPSTPFQKADLGLQNPLLHANLVWIAPPSDETLIERLAGRGTETEEQIQKRLQTATVELSFAQQYGCIFDKIIVNDDLTTAFAELENYIFSLYPSLFAEYMDNKAIMPENKVE